jgi:hypothetical protein
MFEECDDATGAGDCSLLIAFLKSMLDPAHQRVAPAKRVVKNRLSQGCRLEVLDGALVVATQAHDLVDPRPDGCVVAISHLLLSAV